MSVFQESFYGQKVVFYSSMVVIITMGKILLLKRNDYFDFTCTFNRIPKPEDNFVALTSMLAASSGSIGVDLQDIANQPIRFWVNVVNFIALDYIP